MEIIPFEGDEKNNETALDRFNLNYLLFYDNEGEANYSSSNNTNGSYDQNHTVIILRGNSLYPSGYTMPHIIIASIVVTLLMIVVVVGNMLVIIAIATEKALKNIQNWFIASLAVADFFLGLVIMPFSLANEIMGYWIFGNWWCDVHSAMDVLLCTASIMNLCLISLDRYWSITQAVDYLKKRTPVRAAVMITLVWILSGLICIPPLLGWKVDRPVEEFPKCQLSEDIGYVLYSALGSFYIPSCIMVFVYIRIYFAAKARARRGIRKPPRPRQPPEEKCTSFTTLPAQGSGSGDGDKQVGGASGDVNSNSPMRNVVVQGGVTLEHGGIATIVTQPPQPMSIPIVTCDFASDISTSDNAEGTTGQENGDGGGYLQPPKDTLKVMGTAGVLSMPKHPLQTCQFRGSTLSVNGDLAQQQAAMNRCRAPSVGIDTDMVSEFDPSSSDSGVVSRCAVVKPLKLRLCKPIFGRRTTSKAKREMIDMGKASSGHGNHPGSDGNITENVPRIQKPRDPEREKRRIARKKEKRATLILGLIMGSFIACWLPFFFLYILTPICSWCQVPERAFATAFWLGYMNSALNPVIYTIFNKDFRRAFRRILFK